MAGSFDEFSVVSVSQETISQIVFKTFGENFGAKFGTKLGTIILASFFFLGGEGVRLVFGPGPRGPGNPFPDLSLEFSRERPS